jgi:hypothetical protein
VLRSAVTIDASPFRFKITVRVWNAEEEAGKHSLLNCFREKKKLERKEYIWRYYCKQL